MRGPAILPALALAVAASAGCGDADGAGSACAASCIPSFRERWLAVPQCFTHGTFCRGDAGANLCADSADDADCTFGDGAHASVTFGSAGAGNWGYVFDSPSGRCLTVQAGSYHVCAGSSFLFGDGDSAVTYRIEAHCNHQITCPDGTVAPLPAECLADLPPLATGGGAGATCAPFQVSPRSP